jgi:hypothetical protein
MPTKTKPYGLADFKFQQQALERTQDLRDDTMSLVRNSPFTFEDIHAHCGPHPRTLQMWDEKITQRPQMGKRK